jgi:hypothetical protein
MYFYRVSPLLTPPNISNLLAWMDANDLTDVDNTPIATMPNKGALGGTWSTTGPLPPLAATIGGKRTLSFPLAWPSVTPNYGYNVSSFTFPATTAAQGITMVILANQQTFVPDGTNGPNAYLANAGSAAAISEGLNIHAVSVLNPFPLQYRWRTSQPSQTGSTFSAFYASSQQLTGEFVAYATQLSTTITNNQQFLEIRQNNADISVNSDGIATGIVGTLAGSVTIGGLPGGASSYVWSGWIREVLVWNTLVSSADIKSYLNNKYGGTW